MRIQRKSNDPVCLLLTAYCSSTLLYGHIYRAARCGCPWRHCCSPSSGPQQQQQISLCIKREKPTRKHRRTTLPGSTRYSGSLLETTAYSARSSEPIPLWTLRTRANTQHRDYAKYNICKFVSAAPPLRSLAIVGARGGVLRGWCASSGPRRRRHRSGEAPVVTPARVRRHRAPSDGGDRWRPEAPSARRAGCTRVLPPTRHICTRASAHADGERRTRWPPVT